MRLKAVRTVIVMSSCWLLAGCIARESYFFVTLEAQNCEIVEWGQPKPYRHVIRLEDISLMPISFEIRADKYSVRARNPLDDHLSMLVFSAVDQQGNQLGIEAKVVNGCIGRFRGGATVGDSELLQTSVIFELSQRAGGGCTPADIGPNLEIDASLEIFALDGQYIGIENVLLRTVANGYMVLGAGI